MTTMNKRVVLSRAIRGMLIVLCLAFLFVLFRSLSGPSITASTANVFDNVVIGQTALRRVDRQRVWATRLSDSQRRQAIELNALVLDAEKGCDSSKALCLIHAQSSRPGIELVYLNEAPDQLPSNIAWYGGFVDPVSGGVFDFMGRAYKDVGSNDDRESLELFTP